MAGLGFRETENICHASCIYFDDVTELKTLLSLHGNEGLRDRIVAIKGLKHDSKLMTTPVYAVLIGVAQFAQHYHNVRKLPNATWRFDEGTGFNQQSLKLVVETCSAAGVALGAAIVLNDGANFDFMLGSIGLSHCF